MKTYSTGPKADLWIILALTGRIEDIIITIEFCEMMPAREIIDYPVMNTVG